ncbi:AAA domain-containing protein [Rheinheimera pacifica]|uniref:AAA domain-containing protein n=1 Tax=Rheinheimera pacifica TaxID=173990 RepID=UPI002ED99BD2
MAARLYPSFQLKNVLQYWRNSLADEDQMGLDASNFPVRTTEQQIRSGFLDKEAVSKLQQSWAASQKQLTKNQTKTDIALQTRDVIPIIILCQGYAPKHEHGKVISFKNTATAYYTFHIPALLSPSGSLSYSEHSTPWIGREFLHPNEEAEDNIPLIGDVSVQDNWLNQNPLDELTWSEFINWCDELRSAVLGGRGPDGFEPLPDVRIDISTSVRNAARSLCQLFDALQAEKTIPALLKQICEGREKKAVVNAALRTKHMASARGTMSAAYGLADSQSDAIAAYCTLGNAEVLAVNGPPGTGKTTLLQSIIATEIVTRAIAGDEPAVIVGVSTNNQAVTNINRSLNEILQENPAVSLFHWAKRWVPDSETYGLYLPAGEDKIKEAIKNGFKIAVKDFNTWTGFPDKESNPEYIALARSGWLDSYTKIAEAPESLEHALDRLRARLSSILDKITAIQNSLENYQEITRWWANTAGSQAPEIYLRAEDASLSMLIEEATKKLEKFNIDANTAEENLKAAQEKADESISHSKELISEKETYRRKLFDIKSKVNTALAPNGLLESLAEIFDFSKKLFHRNKIARLCAIASEDALTSNLFEKEIASLEPDDWQKQATYLIQNATTELTQLREIQVQQEQQLGKDVLAVEHFWKLAKNRCHIAHKAAEQAKQDKHTRLQHLQEKIREFEQRKRQLYSAYEILKSEAVTNFKIDQNNIPRVNELPDVNSFDRLLDVTWRHMAFQLAMRYWEGRWILAAEAVQKNEVSTNNGQAAMQARFRRWCMLTPCLVMTAHSLPKHFRFTSKSQESDAFISNFLFNFIDLMIMDEAGQVAPHVGSAIFALANKAVVVGDIYQIEPVSKISKGADYANSIRLGLGAMWVDNEPHSPHLVSASGDGSPQGSIMRLAQMATTAVSPNTEKEPGIFLSEHRRCRAEIVDYCNRLVYQNSLICLRAEPSIEPPLRPLMWAHVRGTATKVGSSRANESEAQSVVQWIVDNAEAWQQHYKKALEDIVAVVTPFKPQAKLIKNKLSLHGSQFVKLTVGTVHSLQGAEKSIVVFSPTYNADTVKSMFFDQKPNMLNVAVSRAKDSFVVIGDMRLFRNKRQTPSSILGHMLFSDTRNELSDVDGNHRFRREILVQAERVSALERHREILKYALVKASNGQTILIASPWITVKAIQDDGLETLVQEAVQHRKARIYIVVDGELALRNPTHGGEEALKRIEAAGAKVTKVRNMHNKTLIIGMTEIIEGSFNWLSAQRDSEDKFARHEVSWRVSGEEAEIAIHSALEEFGKLGVNM